MADSVKKNIELNVSGNAKKEFLEIKKTLHELEIRAKWAGKKTEAQIENYIKNSNKYYDEQIKKEKDLDKVRENYHKKETSRINERQKLLDYLAEYKGGKGIVGSTMNFWYSDISKKVKYTPKGEEYSDKLKREINTYEAVGSVVGEFRALGFVLSPVIKGLHTLEKQITANVEAMINFRTGLVTYGSSSLVTNAEARNVRLQWGLSASQYAGFSQAANLLNVKSEEDLYYMNADQRSLFLNYMRKYASYYDKLESSGVLRNIQELQLSFEEFKVEMSYEFLSWVADNRDLITGSLEVIMESVRAIGEFTKGIFNWLRTNNPGVFTPNQLYNNTFTSNSDSGIVGSLDLAALQEAGFVVNS